MSQCPTCGVNKEATVASIQRLRAERDSQQRVCITVMAERDALRAELAECKKDAERYRWLRDDGDGFEITVRETDEDGGETWVAGYPPNELDAAIDAAREGK